ncbi:MAG TPA: prolyl oligopeptidase family serine peptidase, partial [Candidatus Hydrogenedentes bacterium]|nr:prolyl oligopeptidase family serine peptidase [Candidatus Hydrogenedentota bacterium]
TGINAARKYPVLVIHGDADRNVPVENGRLLAQQYEREGHPVEYWEVPALVHDWAPGANDRIAAFYAAHPLGG